MAVSDYERPTITAIIACVGEGIIAWDIGANIGFYSSLMSQVAGPTGQIFAFEPNPDAFMEMERQLNAAHIANVRTLRLALSDADGDVRMIADPDYTSASRIVGSTGATGGRIITIPAFRGDSLIEQGLVCQPTFIKLDVEGHELKAIHGMHKVLSSPDMHAIVCEVHVSLLEANDIKNPLYEIRRLFEGCGLRRQQWISRSHLLARRH